jgi:hypothetical protein
MADPIRASAKRLLQQLKLWREDPCAGLSLEQAESELRAALAAEPPAPAEPDTDAVLTLAAIIRQAAGNGLPGAARLAELILSHPDAASAFQPPALAPATDGKREELARLLDGDAEHLVEVALARECHKTWELARRVIRAAALLREPAPAPVPVPVAERPWKREGWCTEWGWCWVFVQGRWLRNYPQNYPNAACLPHWALPQPPQGGEVAE